jgi:4-amino-4-deoxy-L-arabinose transferase-like glycosyltransferase
VTGKAHRAARRLVRPLSRLRSDRFLRQLSAVTAFGLAVRLVYVLGFRRDTGVVGDPYFYHNGANLLVHGQGFIAPLQFIALHTRLQAADHPPLYMLYLAIPSSLGLGTILVHKLWSALLGTATVALSGLLGRRVAGDRAGLITAFLVAVYPNVWVYDGALLSETMAIFVATLALVYAYRAWERPSTGRLCALGAVCGIAALARSELVVLVPALLWPIAVWADTPAWRARLRRAGAATLVALAVVAPWVTYNLTRFEHPVFLSSQFEATVGGANCHDTYYGTRIGLFSTACMTARYSPHADESVAADVIRKQVTTYVRAHLSRLPVVMGARVARVLGLYRPAQQVDLDVFIEGRERPIAMAGLLGGYAVDIGAIIGAVVLRRRRGPPLFPLLVIPVAVVGTVAITYATDRFRASAEPALCVLTAVALDAIWRRVRTPRDSITPATEDG